MSYVVCSEKESSCVTKSEIFDSPPVYLPPDTKCSETDSFKNCESSESCTSAKPNVVHPIQFIDIQNLLDTKFKKYTDELRNTIHEEFLETL